MATIKIDLNEVGQATVSLAAPLSEARHALATVATLLPGLRLASAMGSGRAPRRRPQGQRIPAGRLMTTLGALLRTPRPPLPPGTLARDTNEGVARILAELARYADYEAKRSAHTTSDS